MSTSKTATLIAPSGKFPIAFVKSEQNESSGKVSYWSDFYPDGKISPDEVLTVSKDVARDTQKLRSAAEKFVSEKLKKPEFRNHSYLQNIKWTPEIRASLVLGERSRVYEIVEKEIQVILKDLAHKPSLSVYEQKLKVELEQAREALQTATFVQTQEPEGRVRLVAQYWNTTGQIYTKEGQGLQSSEENFALMLHELMHRYTENIALQSTYGLPPQASDRRSNQLSVVLDYSGTDQKRYIISNAGLSSLSRYKGDPKTDYDESKWNLNSKGLRAAHHDEVFAYQFTCHYILFKLGITQKEMDETESGNPETVNKILDRFREMIGKNTRLHAELTAGINPGWMAGLLGAYFGYVVNEGGKATQRSTNLHNWLSGAGYSILSHQD